MLWNAIVIVYQNAQQTESQPNLYIYVYIIYCNMFAGSIFKMEVYYTPKVNTQLLITVHNSSKILTLVLQILELQQTRVMSSGS
jgi:hypothetical protein